MCLQNLQKIEDRLSGRQLQHPNLLVLEVQYTGSFYFFVLIWYKSIINSIFCFLCFVSFMCLINPFQELLSVCHLLSFKINQISSPSNEHSVFFFRHHTGLQWKNLSQPGSTFYWVKDHTLQMVVGIHPGEANRK